MPPRAAGNTCYQESALLTIDDAMLENHLSFVRKWRVTMEGKKSKRGRVGEGRPTKRTPEVVAKIATMPLWSTSSEKAIPIKP
jgi:hypothetical protein